MKPFVFSRSEVPESLKRFGLNSVVKVPKSRGFLFVPVMQKKIGLQPPFRGGI